MPQIKVSGLDQGRKYYVRARVQNSSLNLSDWSLPLTFTTAEDKIPPGAIEDLLFESEETPLLPDGIHRRPIKMEVR